MLDDAVLAGSIKKLRADRNQSKLRRILETDMTLIQNYLSPQSFAILTELMKLTEKGCTLKYACVECDQIFGIAELAWSCERCLLWFHPKCKSKFPKSSQREHVFCLECYLG